MRVFDFTEISFVELKCLLGRTWIKRCWPNGAFPSKSNAVIVICAHFRKNTDGRVWADILKENARKEFEQARYERDPEMVSRMLVVGRDALNQAMEKVRRRHSCNDSHGEGEICHVL